MLIAGRGIDPLAKRREEAEEKRSKEKNSVKALVEEYLKALKLRPKKNGGEARSILCWLCRPKRWQR